MNKDYERRDRRRQSTSKKYRVRYDRIVAAVLVLIVLIVIPASCMKSCKEGKKDTKKKSSDTTSDSSNSNSTTGTGSIIDNLITSDETNSILTSSELTAASDYAFTTENYSPTDLSCGSLILVNQDHQYTFPEEDANPITLYDNIKTEYYSVSDYVMRLDSDVIDQLDSMMEAFYNESGSTDIMIIGGFRTLEDQNDKYYSGSSKYQGGYVDYHTARSFDMGIFPKDGSSSSGFYSPTGIYAWIDDHAADYGFIVRYPEGKENFTGEAPRSQTYRYVGVPHATYIKENNLCLEEYISLVKEHNNSEPLEVKADSKLYHVYYAPVTSAGGTTAVPVPVNKTYTVSGDNADGFIVTVSLN